MSSIALVRSRPQRIRWTGRRFSRRLRADNGGSRKAQPVRIPARSAHVVEEQRDGVAHLSARHNPIHHSVVAQKL